MPFLPSNVAILDAAQEPAADPSVSMLIRTLVETDRRLEELTAGEVDTVTDRQGRSFMLRRAQERWRKSGADKQAAVLDALAAHVALLDAEGTVLSVNESWRRFADSNGLRDTDHAIGRNYLTICDNVTGEEASDAAHVAGGIRTVLLGVAASFSFEYPCNSLTEERWFLLTVTPIESDLALGAVVMHLDITARKRGEEELRHFAAAMDASPDGIFLIDRSNVAFVYANEAACRMHMMERIQVLALKPWEAMGRTREDLERIYDGLVADGGYAAPEEALWSRKGGPPIWIEIRRHAQRIGGRWTIVVLVRDVSARKEADSRIAYLNRVRAVLSGINTLIVRVRSRDELFREACRIAVEQGAMAMTWIGTFDQGTRHVAPTASAGMSEEFLSAITERLDSCSIDSPGSSLATLVLKEKRVFVANDSQNDPRVKLGEMHAKYGIHSTAMFPLTVAGEVAGIWVLYARETDFFHHEQLRLLTELAGDVAFAMEQIEKQERLDYLAFYDVLTGLANRTLFLERLTQYVRVAATGGHKLAVCIVDLERFKNINDSLGRLAGDSLLKQVAQWLVSLVGDANLVARIDADRFAVVIPSAAGEDTVARILGKAIKAFHNHQFSLNDTAYRIAAKVGAAMFPEDGDTAELLFKHAEAAQRKAKGGTDGFMFYARKMTEATVGRLNMENQLRRALEMDEFVLHYQPKVDVASRKLVGAEALIRWNDPHTGLVSPGEFIPILEETGLIHEVGRWALNKAMQDYNRWRAAGLPVVRIAVNLSPLQLRNRGLIDHIRHAVGADPQGAAGLELEITETLIMADVKHSISALQSIRDMGVRIAIDDFGTGCSSLSYLSKLPIDSVKIDRSFIVDLVASPEGLTLVSVIINLAHSLKLKVVAEGVETEQQARLLRLLDCDEMQGFLLSKALPAAIFEEKFLASNAPSA
jgi:diguanylate cyclase (GGDEF)-like protein/PAS domain S-box-containing protein